ncbi:MBL fold metallo-hydrolase [Rhizobium sp.]|uniref:MBL fold metallo-hydrolase n=1 Tax=Rhizobium sp. TaxID=391 RepID=UPI002AA79001
MNENVTPSTLNIVQFTVGHADINAFCDGVLTAPVASLYRRGSDQPTPEAFADAPTQLSINAFLVKADGKLVLIDTGSGQLFGPEHGKLSSYLAQIGHSADEIDDIILTHIHSDHSGGLISDGAPVFKKATLHIGKTEADFWLSPGAADVPNASDRLKGQIGRAHTCIDPYQQQGQVQIFEDEGAILPGFSASLRAGHTPGHVSIRFESNGQVITFVGDIVHGDKLQFADPSITIDFDYDQKTAAISRASAFKQAAEEGYLIAAAHIPFPGVGYVRNEGGHYRFEALKSV